MNELKLYSYDLIKLTESDLIYLCKLNNFKPDELIELNLNNNELTNINFIQKNTVFINLKELWICDNPIKDINNIKYLMNLEILGISRLKLVNEKETVKMLKSMKKLKYLLCHDVFTLNIKSELPGIKILK